MEDRTPQPPAFITIDMGQPSLVKGLALANRENLNGAIKDFELFVSADNVSWTNLGNFTAQKMMNWQYIDLPAVQTFRYFKIVTQNSHGDFNYAQLAEVSVYAD